MSPSPTRSGEKFTVPVDLYDDQGRHWGQIRLVQYGQSTLLQVCVDADQHGWQDFQAFVITDDVLKFGVIGKRPK